MKKILKSIFVLGLVGGLAFGITQAFFSDTETSTGNVLQAGSIDLKVDHVLARYNGEDCQEQCVEQENLVQNISFEEPVVTTTQKWDIYDSPVGGWNVDWYDGSTSFGGQTRPEPAHLEYHRGVLGNAYEGEQYVELDSDWDGPGGSLTGEPASVTIYQDIATTPGANYKLRFAFAPRPNTDAATNRLEVKWGGVVVWDSGNQGDANAGIEWQYKEFDVSATSNSTELRFTDLGTADSLGSFIDDITINEIVCEPVIGQNQCRLWEEKDLDGDDFFWNLSDIKPGDNGVNVISLHSYDNDAWACMYAQKTDLENVLTEPEAEAGDVTENEGELSKYVDAFVWKEVGPYDGVYNPATEEGTFYDSFFDVFVDLATPDSERLVASTTNYFGIAWCIGDLTVGSDGTFTCDGSGDNSDAMTDILNVDLSFYAEQVRNNPDFSCENLSEPE